MLLAPILIAATIAAMHPGSCSQGCQSKRLAAFILERNDSAGPFAEELAARIVRESRRFRIPVASLAAIAWIESDYRRGRKGRAHELGLWQLRTFDTQLANGWRYVRSMPGEFPIAKGAAPRPWPKLRRSYRERVIQNIRAGTYLAALEINHARAVCRRLGHRIGPWRCDRPFVSQCPRYHGQEVDRLGHYNSGISWPRGHYVAKLRRRSRTIRARLAN